MQDSDRKLIEIIRSYLNDMLANTYNALINETFDQIKKGSELVAEFDNLHFFKLSAFMIKVQRLKAQEEHEAKVKEALEKA